MKLNLLFKYSIFSILAAAALSGCQLGKALYSSPTGTTGNTGQFKCG